MRQLLYFCCVAYVVVAVFVAVGHAMHGGSNAYTSRQAVFEDLAAGLSWPWQVVRFFDTVG